MAHPVDARSNAAGRTRSGTPAQPRSRRIHRPSNAKPRFTDSLHAQDSGLPETVVGSLPLHAMSPVFQPPTGVSTSVGALSGARARTGNAAVGADARARAVE